MSSTKPNAAARSSTDKLTNHLRSSSGNFSGVAVFGLSVVVFPEGTSGVSSAISISFWVLILLVSEFWLSFSSFVTPLLFFRVRLRLARLLVCAFLAFAVSAVAPPPALPLLRWLFSICDEILKGRIHFRCRLLGEQDAAAVARIVWCGVS